MFDRQLQITIIDLVCTIWRAPNKRIWVIWMTRYATEKKKTDWCYIPGKGQFFLDWDKLQSFNDRCFLVALDERQISVLLAHLAVFPQFSHIWSLPRRASWDASIVEKWENINDFVEDLERCLMSGCEVEKLIFSNLLIAAAVSGDSVDLDANLDDIMTGVKNYATIGLRPQFVANSGSNIADVAEDAADQATIDLLAIKDAIDGLVAAIAAGEDIEDDLANVWFTIEAVATILGAEVGAPPTPL